jgi:hypothetical protein
MVSTWKSIGTHFVPHMFQNNQFHPTYFSGYGDAIPPQKNLICKFLGQGHLHKKKEIHFKCVIGLRESSDK